MRFETITPHAGGQQMTDTLLGPWVRRFLLEYLVTECNLARGTRSAAIGTPFALLIPFVAQHARKKRFDSDLGDRDVSSDVVRLFHQHLEESRKCGVATRNQRLAAIHLFGSLHQAAQPKAYRVVQAYTIPPKRAPRSTITYLEKPEMDALLNAPDKSTDQAFRTLDHALLLFLYNTGARADEAAQTKIVDLTLSQCAA